MEKVLKLPKGEGDKELRRIKNIIEKDMGIKLKHINEAYKIMCWKSRNSKMYIPAKKILEILYGKNKTNS